MISPRDLPIQSESAAPSSFYPGLNDGANTPGGTEICDGQDNDCTGGANFDAAGEVDADNDGSLSCADCDDGDGANTPGGTEVCDGQDNDCVGGPNFDVAGESNVDGDAFLSCAECNDLEATVYPGAPELCGDGFDNNCNGTLDEGCGGGGGQYDGLWSVSPTPLYSCLFGTLIVTFPDLTVSDNNPNISFQTNGRAGTMTGTITGNSFTASSFLPGGGLCDETYTLTGTFTSATTYTATFSATYVGGLCLDCTGYSVNISGSL